MKIRYLDCQLPFFTLCIGYRDKSVCIIGTYTSTKTQCNSRSAITNTSSPPSFGSEFLQILAFKVIYLESFRGASSGCRSYIGAEREAGIMLSTTNT